MSRIFSGPAGTYNIEATRLLNANAINAAYPLTWVSHFYPTDLTLPMVMMCLDDVSSAWPIFAMYVRGDQAGDYAQFLVRESSGAHTVYNVDTPNACNINEWNVCVARVDAAGLATIWLNDGASAQQAGMTVPTDMDRAQIGIRGDGFGGTRYESPFKGALAYTAMYDSALSDADVALLLLNTYPDDAALPTPIAYWKIAGDEDPEPDETDVYPMSLVNSGPQGGDDPTMIGGDTPDPPDPARVAVPIQANYPADVALSLIYANLAGEPQVRGLKSREYYAGKIYGNMAGTDVPLRAAYEQSLAGIVEQLTGTRPANRNAKQLLTAWYNSLAGTSFPIIRAHNDEILRRILEYYQT